TGHDACQEPAGPAGSTRTAETVCPRATPSWCTWPRRWRPCGPARRLARGLAHPSGDDLVHTGGTDFAGSGSPCGRQDTVPVSFRVLLSPASGRGRHWYRWDALVRAVDAATVSDLCPE